VRVLAASLDALERRQFFNATPHLLSAGPLRQNWENTGLIANENIWDNVPSIEGFTGNSFVVSANIDPQTLLGPDTPGIKQVDANSSSNPDTYVASGNVELSLNPFVGNSGANTVAFQGGGSTSIAPAPYLKFYLDATDMRDIVVRYDLIDIDGGSNASGIQKVALQYRIGTSGNFTNVALGYVPQASDPGGTGKGKTTPVNVTLPANVDGETHVEVRVITADIQGSDQLIAVENINVSATPIDNAPGEFSFEQSAYTVSEGIGNATFTVRRLNGTGGVASVAYATSDGTALTPGDYTDRAGVLTFGDGVDSLAFTVPIVNDSLVESSETFNLTLSNPTGGAALGTPSTATVNITDNEVVGEIAFSPASYSRSENAGAVTLTVTRTAGSTGAASVNWTTVNNTAVSPSDFIANSGTLTFDEGETTKTIVITLVDDLVEESAEQFKVSLTNPVNATLGSAYDATVTITNEDFAGTLGFGTGNYTVSESAGTVTLTVNRVNGTSGAASVNWATVDGTATSPADYSGASGTLNFANGETSRTITIDLVDNGIQDADKQFTVVLSSVTGASLGSDTATVTITNDDVTGQFAFDPTAYSVSEDGDSITLTVTRSLGSSGPASVAWTSVNGTATGGDYVAAGGTLNFASGETSKTIIITLIDDAIAESDETFSVVLSNPTNGATLGAASATVTIADDDSNVPTGLLLSEIDLNPPGSDLPYQFVELRGAPGFVLHNVYLLEVEGDTIQNPGTINAILSLEGATIGSNGLLLIRSSAGFAPESSATGVFDTPLFDVGGIDFEPGSASFVLLFDFGTFSLAIDTDLDPFNDGTLELPESATVLDAVGALDGTINDRAYGAVVGPASTNPFISDAPDAFTRFTSDLRPSTSAAWFWGNLVGGVSNSKTYTTNTDQRSANFPAGGILTPGGVMSGAVVSVVSGVLDYAGSSQSVVVTFDQDVGASLAAGDFELVNLTAGGAPIALTLLSVSGNGTVAHLGFTGTGGLTPNLLADGDYRLRVKADEVGNSAGSLPTDALFTFFFKNADLNHDRSVGFDDLLLLAQNYGTQSGATFVTGDVNYDGRVDFDDLLALAQRYGQTLLTATPTGNDRHSAI
jgi:hypothetical protein